MTASIWEVPYLRVAFLPFSWISTKSKLLGADLVLTGLDMSLNRGLKDSQCGGLGLVETQVAPNLDQTSQIMCLLAQTKPEPAFSAINPIQLSGKKESDSLIK